MASDGGVVVDVGIASGKDGMKLEGESRAEVSEVSVSASIDGVSDNPLDGSRGKMSHAMRFSSDLGVQTPNVTEAVSPSSPILQQSETAPLRANSTNQLLGGHHYTHFRFKMDRKGVPKHDLKFDRLSDCEKKLLIENLVRVKNDGSLEVDVSHNAHVASELLELDATPEVLEAGTFEFVKSVPRLKIAILVVGTRGDVQPFLAMAKRLQEFGHHVRLATHVNFCNFVKSAGVEFFPLGGDPRVMARYMAKTKGFLLSGPTEISTQRKQLKAIINSLLPACTEPDLDSGASFRAQAIIANPPAYGHAHVAEALGVPLHIFFTMPWTPTHQFSHPLARVPQSAGYKLSYYAVDLLIWWGIRGFINDFRKQKLKLPPIAYFSTYHGSISHLPTGYMWSPHLVAKPDDWGTLVDVVGYCFLNLGTRYQPPEKLQDWLRKGPQPIYIGFGSMPVIAKAAFKISNICRLPPPLDDAKRTTTIILEALKETGQRGIIVQGWGDLGTLLEVPEDVFLLGDCPHDWLFPQCSAVVHHGGAGTTATGLRAGCPTTIIPFFGDQFFWGDMIHDRGVGPAPIPISELNTERLADAIRFMLELEVKQRVLELAKEIGNEDGVAAAVDAFHRHLPPEMPLPPPSVSDDDEDDNHPNPVKWLLKTFERCCLPFVS